jgi:tetratricopeptide (TPR) repeat protein
VLSLLENNPRGALAQVLDGLSACGDRSELLELLVPLEANFGTDDSLLNVGESLLRAAREAKTDPTKWCLAANAAIALNRHDIALAACQQALAIQPNHPAACQTAAWLHIRHGEPKNFVAARDTLLSLGKDTLRTNPVLTRLNARTMIETGLNILLDDEFKAIVEAQAAMKPKTTAPAIGFLLGVFDAEPDLERAERAEWVAAHATQLLASEPNAPSARRVRAEALFRVVDLTATANPKGGPPVFGGDRVAAAMRAFEELPPEERTEASAAAGIALLQLKGQGNVATAMRTVGALQAVEGSLNSRQLEALGVVLAANGRTAEAIRVMERAIRMPRPSAGLWIALALAYHKNKQPNDAQAALAQAHDTPNRSTREQLELVAAKQHLAKDNQ